MWFWKNQWWFTCSVHTNTHALNIIYIYVCVCDMFLYLHIYIYVYRTYIYIYILTYTLYNYIIVIYIYMCVNSKLASFAVFGDDHPYYSRLWRLAPRCMVWRQGQRQGRKFSQPGSHPRWNTEWTNGLKKKNRPNHFLMHDIHRNSSGHPNFFSYFPVKFYDLLSYCWILTRK